MEVVQVAQRKEYKVLRAIIARQAYSLEDGIVFTRSIEHGSIANICEKVQTLSCVTIMSAWRASSRWGNVKDHTKV